MQQQGRGLAPLTGLAFVVLVIVGFAVGGEPPDLDEPAQELVDFYSEDKDLRFLGASLAAVGATLFVFFGGYLKTVLQDAERPAPGPLPTIMFAGVLIFATGVAIDSTITFALAETATDIDPAAVQALAALFQNDFIPLAVGLQIFLLALGFSILRHRALPKWIGWIAILFGLIAVTPIGFVAFFAAGLLTIVMSILLAMRARRDPPAREGTTG